MENLFTEHTTLACIILVLFIFSLLCQIVIGFLYQNMIKETYNMSSTKNKRLKTCKLKFTNRYELHEGVANVTVFVDKFLHGMKLGPVSVGSLQHLSGQLLLFAVFAAGVGACRAIAAEETIGNILAYYLVAFFMLYVYFSAASAVDVKGKREILKTNLIDYLENNISVRIPQSKKEQERLDELEAVALRQKGEGAAALRQNDEGAAALRQKSEGAAALRQKGEVAAAEKWGKLGQGETERGKAETADKENPNAAGRNRVSRGLLAGFRKGAGDKKESEETSDGIMDFAAHKKQGTDKKHGTDRKRGTDKKQGTDERHIMNKRLDEEEAMELEGLLREFVSGT